MSTSRFVARTDRIRLIGAPPCPGRQVGRGIPPLSMHIHYLWVAPPLLNPCLPPTTKDYRAPGSPNEPAGTRSDLQASCVARCGVPRRQPAAASFALGTMSGHRRSLKARQHTCREQSVGNGDVYGRQSLAGARPSADYTHLPPNHPVLRKYSIRDGLTRLRDLRRALA